MKYTPSRNFIVSASLLVLSFFTMQGIVVPNIIRNDLKAVARMASIELSNVVGVLRADTWEEFDAKNQTVNEKFLGYYLEKTDGKTARISVPKELGENLDGRSVLYNTKTGKLDIDSSEKILDIPIGTDSLPGFKKIKTLVLLTQFGNSTPVDVTAEEYEDRLFGNNGYVNKFYGEMTHGKVKFDADVRGWYTLPGPGTDYTGQFFDFCFVPQEMIVNQLAPQYQIDLSNYDLVISISNCEEYANLGGQGETWNPDPTGVQFIRILGHQDRLGVYTESSYTDWPGLVWNINHEIGHTMGTIGSAHAKGYDCNDTTLGFLGNNLGVQSNCHSIMYGNPFDAMGDWGGRVFGFLKQWQAGWITDSDILDIHEGGQYFIHNLQAPSGVVAARIYIPGTNVPLFAVEHRKSIGFDSGLSTGPGSVSDGLILYVNKSDVWPIVDPHPTNLAFKDDTRNDSISTTNPFYSDEYGIGINISEVTDEGILFSVDFSAYNDSPCGIFVANHPTPFGDYQFTQIAYQMPNYPVLFSLENMYYGISDQEAPCVHSTQYTLTAIDSDVPEFIGDTNNFLIDTSSPSYTVGFHSQTIIPLGEHHVTVRATNVVTDEYQDYSFNFSVLD